MQQKPDGWAEGDVEVIPEMRLVLDGSVWPPSDGELPQGSARVGSWSVSRDLTGGGLPGAARGGAGFSIATGSAEFPQPESAPLTPWGVVPLHPGVTAKLEACQGSIVGEGLSIGKFILDAISGDNTTGVVAVDLQEASTRLNRPFTFQWVYKNAAFDASEIIVEAAKSAGFTDEELRIDDSGSMIKGVFNVSGQTCWQVIQEIAAATMGAAWLAEDGVLIYRNRSALRTGTHFETVEALDSLESLDWSVSLEGMADRVTLSYNPANITTDTSGRTTLWESSDPIGLSPYASRSIYIDIEGTTDRFSPFLPIWDETTAGDSGTWSRWAAAYSRDGGGERPADNAVAVTIRQISPSQIRLIVTNTTDKSLWLVDASGNPTLILRTTLFVEPGETQTVSWGRPEEDAENTFEFNAGQWVQEPSVASTMLTWLSAQLETPNAVVGDVRVSPNLARQIGDIILLVDASSDLRVKALIIGIDLAGDSTGYSQSLRLAILDYTFSDFDSWANSAGVVTFDDFDNAVAAAGITTFDEFESWLRRQSYT